MMLHGGNYGKRRGPAGSNVLLIFTVVLGFAAVLFGGSWWSARSSLHSTFKVLDDTQRQMDNMRLELSSIKARLASRTSELDHVSTSLQNTQQRLTEAMIKHQHTDSEYQELAGQLLHTQREKEAMTSREAHANAMVEWLKSEADAKSAEANYSLTYIETLRKTIGDLSRAHAERENDWHALADKWHQDEVQLQKEIDRLVLELAKPAAEHTEYKVQPHSLPPEEPQVREETKFNVEIPKYDEHFHHIPLPQPVALATATAGSADNVGKDAAGLPLPHHTATTTTHGGSGGGMDTAARVAANAYASGVRHPVDDLGDRRAADVRHGGVADGVGQHGGRDLHGGRRDAPHHVDDHYQPYVDPLDDAWVHDPYDHHWDSERDHYDRERHTWDHDQHRAGGGGPAGRDWDRNEWVDDGHDHIGGAGSGTHDQRGGGGPVGPHRGSGTGGGAGSGGAGGQQNKRDGDGQQYRTGGRDAGRDVGRGVGRGPGRQQEQHAVPQAARHEDSHRHGHGGDLGWKMGGM